MSNTDRRRLLAGGLLAGLPLLGSCDAASRSPQVQCTLRKAEQVTRRSQRALALSLADLKRMPTRTQITKHDCVEGWTSIGKWKGTRLSAVLRRAGLRPEARYIMFYCFDALDQQPDGERYYESIGLDDAFHEQTILAWEMNDRPLPIRHGAPLRLRVERQLGYKHAKYVRRIEAVESFENIRGGKGGYWEDRGYEWYAGI